MQHHLHYKVQTNWSALSSSDAHTERLSNHQAPQVVKMSDFLGFTDWPSHEQLMKQKTLGPTWLWPEIPCGLDLGNLHSVVKLCAQEVMETEERLRMHLRVTPVQCSACEVLGCDRCDWMST